MEWLKEVCPGIHATPPFLEVVRAAVRRLDLVADRVRQCGLRHLA